MPARLCSTWDALYSLRGRIVRVLTMSLEGKNVILWIIFLAGLFVIGNLLVNRGFSVIVFLVLWLGIVRCVFWLLLRCPHCGECAPKFRAWLRSLDRRKMQILWKGILTPVVYRGENNA
jgi:hypothetical protein